MSKNKKKNFLDDDEGFELPDATDSPQNVSSSKRPIPYRLRLAFMGAGILLLAIVVILMFFMLPSRKIKKQEDYDLQEVTELLDILHLNIVDLGKGQEALEKELLVILKSLKHHTKPSTNPSTDSNSGQKVTYGIDASHWNGNFEKDILKNKNIQFAIIKATEGVGGASSVDLTFRKRWHFLGKHPKYYRGAYHFFKFSDEGKKQAKHYYNTVELGGPRDFPPILDLETPQGDEKLKRKKSFVKRIHREFKACLEETERLFGQKPMIYINLSDANTYLGNDLSLAKYPLWLAEWTSKKSPSEIPEPWKSADKKNLFWQRTNSYVMNGDTFDLDVFSHPYSDLKNLSKFY